MFTFFRMRCDISCRTPVSLCGIGASGASWQQPFSFRSLDDLVNVRGSSFSVGDDHLIIWKPFKFVETSAKRPVVPLLLTAECFSMLLASCGYFFEAAHFYWAVEWKPKSLYRPNFIVQNWRNAVERRFGNGTAQIEMTGASATKKYFGLEFWDFCCDMTVVNQTAGKYVI